jgi:Zn-dependent protease with chaperone function
MLDRIELEAVVAHELAHIKRHDTLSGCVAAATCGRLGAQRLAAKIAGPAREPLADLGATRLTRYPPGLVSALERVSETGSTRPEALSPSTLRATAGLWLVPVTDAPPGRRPRRDGSRTGEDGPAAGAVELPGELDLEERIALLREL